MKRYLFAITVIVLVLTGCGNAGSGNSNAVEPTGNTAAPEPQQSPAGDNAEPQTESATRIAIHSLGETEIPAEPQRIAVTHQVVLDWLEPLGLKVSVSPEATQELQFQPYTPQWQRDGMQLLGPPGDPNLEALLDAEPDLIIANWGHDKVYDQLNLIAPTLFFAPNDNWQDLLRQYGTAFDREQQAEQWLADYGQKAAEAKEALAGLSEEIVVFIRFLPKDLRIYTNHPTSSVGGVLYHDLGLKPVAPPSAETMYDSISLEGLSELNPDHIFMQTGFIVDQTDEATQRFNEMTGSEVWKRISAVEKNQVYPVDSAFFSNTAMAKSYQIDVVLEHLADKAKR